MFHVKKWFTLVYVGTKTWCYHCACFFKHLTLVYVEKQQKHGITMFHAKKIKVYDGEKQEPKKTWYYLCTR